MKKKTDVHCILYITLKFITHDYLKMTERGEPKNLIVEDKKTDEKMTERGEPKNLVDEDKRAADIKAVKGPMKRTMLQMIPLIKPAARVPEAALMYQILAENLEKIKNEITTLTKEEILQLLGEEED